MRSWFTLIALYALGACTQTTGGSRVQFYAEVKPTAPIDQLAGRPVIAAAPDAAGWRVTLTEAVVYIGPVYLWSDEPLIQTHWSPAAWLAVNAAYAQQTDQFNAGFLRGEVTEQLRVDLLDPTPRPLGVGEGLGGPSRSGEIWLEPVLRGTQPTVRLAGTATRDEQTVSFSADITYEPPWLDGSAGSNPILLRRLRGLLWQADLDDDGLLTVSIDARAFVVDLPWDTLVDEDQPVALRPNHDAGRILAARVRQLGARGAWSLSWTAP